MAESGLHKTGDCTRVLTPVAVALKAGRSAGGCRSMVAAGIAAAPDTAHSKHAVVGRRCLGMHSVSVEGGLLEHRRQELRDTCAGQDTEAGGRAGRTAAHHSVVLDHIAGSGSPDSAAAGTGRLAGTTSWRMSLRGAREKVCAWVAL